MRNLPLVTLNSINSDLQYLLSQSKGSKQGGYQTFRDRCKSLSPSGPETQHFRNQNKPGDSGQELEVRGKRTVPMGQGPACKFWLNHCKAKGFFPLAN